MTDQIYKAFTITVNNYTSNWIRTRDPKVRTVYDLRTEEAGLA
jgi:hypothetical protein